MRMRGLTDFDRPQTTSIVESTAHNFKVSIRDLRPRVLLQVHRPSFLEVASSKEVIRVAESEASLLRSAVDELEQKYEKPRSPVSISELRIRVLSPEDAHLIFGRIHYLRRVPPGARCLAGVHPATGLPVVAIAYEDSRWRSVRRALRGSFGIPQVKVIDVSRVHTLESSPKGAVSWILSRLLGSLRRLKMPEAILSTAVDSTLGFQGISYRAAGWRHAVTVEPRPYTYVDGIYASAGYLKCNYGTADIAQLCKLLGSRFSYSDPSLRGDTLIFARTTEKGNRPPLKVSAITRRWVKSDLVNGGQR